MEDEVAFPVARSAIFNALGPEMRMREIAPTPTGEAIATIVGMLESAMEPQRSD